MSEKFKYSGELNKPISLPNASLLETEEDIEEAVKNLVREQYRRMVKLFDAHNIPHGNWEALCFALAEAHVPGLRVTAKNAGRPSKWDWMTCAKLRLAVDEMGGNVTEATEKLATMEPWKTMLIATRGAETLRDCYTRTKPRHVETYRKALAYALLNYDSKKDDAPK